MRKIEYSGSALLGSLLSPAIAMDIMMMALHGLTVWSNGGDFFDGVLRLVKLNPLSNASWALGLIGNVLFLAMLIFAPVRLILVGQLRWMNRTFNPTYARCMAACSLTGPFLAIFLLFFGIVWVSLTDVSIQLPILNTQSVSRAILIFVIPGILQGWAYRAIAPIRKLGDYETVP